MTHAQYHVHVLTGIILIEYVYAHTRMQSTGVWCGTVVLLME